MAPHRAAVPRRPGRTPLFPLAAEPLPLGCGDPGGAAARARELRQRNRHRARGRPAARPRPAGAQPDAAGKAHHRVQPVPGRAPEAPARGCDRAHGEARAHRAARHRANIAARRPVGSVPRVVRLQGPRRRAEGGGEAGQLLRRHERPPARRAGRPDEPVPRGPDGRCPLTPRGAGDEAQGVPRAQLGAPAHADADQHAGDPEHPARAPGDGGVAGEGPGSQADARPPLHRCRRG